MDKSFLQCLETLPTEIIKRILFFSQPTHKTAVLIKDITTSIKTSNHEHLFTIFKPIKSGENCVPLWSKGQIIGRLPHVFMTLAITVCECE